MGYWEKAGVGDWENYARVKSHSAKEIIYYLQMGRRKPSLSPITNQLERGLEPTRIKYEWNDYGAVHTPTKHKIWQKDSYDFNIFSLEKYQEKLNYIHNNPVRAKIVEKPENYKWSSYRSLYLNDHSVFKVDQIEL